MEVRLKLLVGNMGYVVVGNKGHLKYRYDSEAETYDFPPFPCGYLRNPIPPWTQNWLLDEDDWRGFVWRQFFKQYANWTFGSGPERRVIEAWSIGLGVHANQVQFLLPCSFFWAVEKLFLAPARVPTFANIYGQIDGYDLTEYLSRLVEEASQLRPCNSPMCSAFVRQKEVTMSPLHRVVENCANQAELSALAAKRQERLAKSAAEIAAKQADRAANNRGSFV